MEFRELTEEEVSDYEKVMMLNEFVANAPDERWGGFILYMLRLRGFDIVKVEDD